MKGEVEIIAADTSYSDMKVKERKEERERKPVSSPLLFFCFSFCRLQITVGKLGQRLLFVVMERLFMAFFLMVSGV